MNWLKHQWEKFKNLPTGKKSMVVGGFVVVIVFIVYLISKNTSSTDTTSTSDTTGTTDSTTGTTSSGTVSSGTSSSGVYDSTLQSQLQAYEEQLYASNQANLASLASSYQPSSVYNSDTSGVPTWLSQLLGLGTTGQTSTSGTSGLFSGGTSSYSGGSSTDSFGLGYNASSAFDGSLGYTSNPFASNLTNKALGTVTNGLTGIASLFGYNIGNQLTRTDNTALANAGLDRTGVLAQNFGGLPAGVTEQQAVSAFNNAMNYNSVTNQNTTLSGLSSMSGNGSSSSGGDSGSGSTSTGGSSSGPSSSPSGGSD